MFRIFLTFWISIYMDLSTKIRKNKNISLSQIVENFFLQMWIFLFCLATQFFCDVKLG